MDPREAPVGRVLGILGPDTEDARAAVGVVLLADMRELDVP